MAEEPSYLSCYYEEHDQTGASDNPGEVSSNTSNVTISDTIFM